MEITLHKGTFALQQLLLPSTNLSQPRNCPWSCGHWLLLHRAGSSGRFCSLQQALCSCVYIAISPQVRWFEASSVEPILYAIAVVQTCLGKFKSGKNPDEYTKGGNKVMRGKCFPTRWAIFNCIFEANPSGRWRGEEKVCLFYYSATSVPGHSLHLAQLKANPPV